MKGHEPPKDVQACAQRAREWIADGKADASFTDVGRARARQLAAGDPVSDEVIAKMTAYFARHAVDKKATGFRRGEDGYPSPGRVAWDAWGGDAGDAGRGRSTSTDVDDRLALNPIRDRQERASSGRSVPMWRS